MEQGLFDLDGEDTTTSVVVPAPTWNWWDVWPATLSVRDQLLWQVRRDLRALSEEEDPWWQVFFADRIVLMQDELKRLT